MLECRETHGFGRGFPVAQPLLAVRF
jgi:hypothetical protein